MISIDPFNFVWTGADGFRHYNNGKKKIKSHVTGVLISTEHQRGKMSLYYGWVKYSTIKWQGIWKFQTTSERVFQGKENIIYVGILFFFFFQCLQISKLINVKYIPNLRLHFGKNKYWQLKLTYTKFMGRLHNW